MLFAPSPVAQELAEEASVPELVLSPLQLEGSRDSFELLMNRPGRVTHGSTVGSGSFAVPVSSPLKFRRNLIPAQPGEKITAAASESDSSSKRGEGTSELVTRAVQAVDRTKRNGGGADIGSVGFGARSPRARPGVVSPLKLERVSRGGAATERRSGNGMTSCERASSGAPLASLAKVAGGCTEMKPAGADVALPPGVVPPPPQEPSKRRRNLDWGVGGGGGSSGSGGRFKLYTPQYGAGGGALGDDDGGGAK